MDMKIYLVLGVVLAAVSLSAGERPKVAVFGGSFSCIKPSEVAKRAWSEALDCDVVNFGMGGMGFLRGADKTNDIPNQVRKALATKSHYAAFVLWASTNDLRYPVEEQNASISNCVRLIRQGAPDSKILFFASMPWPLNPTNNAKLAMLVEGQLETCRQLNVPCLDLFHESGITAENAVLYTAADKHHPNVAGYEKVASLQVEFLKTHLPFFAHAEVVGR